LKRILLIVAFAALAVTPGLAADMAVKASPAPTAVAAYNWAGWYVGGNVGYGWGTNTGGGYSSFVDPAGGTGIGGVGAFFATGGNVLPGVNPKGIIGGGQIGYDWQTSPVWVLGVVADLQGSGMKASGTGAAPPLSGFISITEAKTAKIDWFGTVRGKVGYAANNWLVYATGGLAYGKVKANTAFNDPSFAASSNPISFAGSSSSTKAGGTVGAGIQYGLSPNWTVGAEYLYVNLGSISVTETRVTGTGAGGTGATFTSNSKFGANIARVFINYKFGP